MRRRTRRAILEAIYNDDDFLVSYATKEELAELERLTHHVDQPAQVEHQVLLERLFAWLRADL